MILRIDAVLAETGHRSHSSIYTAVAAGLFPEPIKIGLRATGWPDSEVAAILKARIAGQSDDQIRALVKKLHQARAAESDQPFTSDFAARSARVKELASRRIKPVIA